MTSIARLAALDSRVEAFVRDNPDCRMGDIARSPSVAEIATYAQVVISVERLHAAKRITRTGAAKARRYAVPVDLAKMTSVGAREPRLGETVWASDGLSIWRGLYSMRVEEMDTQAVYFVDAKKAYRISLDGHKLIAEIEREYQA